MKEPSGVAGIVTLNVTKKIASNKMDASPRDFAQVISGPPVPHMLQKYQTESRRENIIVSDPHRPFCTPTIHILATRNQETKTFPKSTYASGDDGIPRRVKTKLHLSEQNRDFIRITGK